MRSGSVTPCSPAACSDPAQRGERWTRASTTSSPTSSNDIFQVVFYPDRIYHARLPQRDPQQPLPLQRPRGAQRLRYHGAEGRGLPRWHLPQQRAARRVSRQPADGGRPRTQPLPARARADEHPPARPGRRPERASAGTVGQPVAALRQMDQRLPDGDLGERLATATQVARLQGAAIRSAVQDQSPASSTSSRCCATSSGCAGSRSSFRENDLDLPFGYRINEPAVRQQLPAQPPGARIRRNRARTRTPSTTTAT